jgi:hypothetical protein
MLSRFDPVLHLMDPENDAPVTGLRAGPCGRGPVDAGVTIPWMEVWFFQRTPEGMAVATGRSGADVHGTEDQPPYEGRWMIRTGLGAQSGEFSPDAPVTALAIAQFLRPDGTSDVMQWTEAVSLHAGHHDHGDAPQA